MLKRVNALHDYKIFALDGDVGIIDDIYFNGCTWKTAYFIVSTGPWLLGQKVLLSPDVIQSIPQGGKKVVLTKLTQEQVKNSPEIDLAKPVSRQQLESLHQYYHWSWAEADYPAIVYAPQGAQPMVTIPPTIYPASSGPLPASVQEELKAALDNKENTQPCLRSCREVEGYSLQATDGEIGHVDDFFVEQGSWMLRYLLVDTGGWLTGKKVLVATDWVNTISWAHRDVYVKLDKNKIESSPEFNRNEPLTREDEIQLYKHYGRQGYWTGVNG